MLFWHSVEFWEGLELQAQWQGRQFVSWTIRIWTRQEDLWRWSPEIFRQLSRIWTVKKIDTIEQAWATSGPPITLMWPASSIWSYIKSYFDFQSVLYSRNYLLYQITSKWVEFNPYFLALRNKHWPPWIPNLALIWPAKPKELPTPAVEHFSRT